jgi:hypothetical protein
MNQSYEVFDLLLKERRQEIFKQFKLDKQIRGIKGSQTNPWYLKVTNFVMAIYKKPVSEFTPALLPPKPSPSESDLAGCQTMPDCQSCSP